MQGQDCVAHAVRERGQGQMADFRAAFRPDLTRRRVWSLGHWGVKQMGLTPLLSLRPKDDAGLD